MEGVRGLEKIISKGVWFKLGILGLLLKIKGLVLGYKLEGEKRRKNGIFLGI